MSKHLSTLALVLVSVGGCGAPAPAPPPQASAPAPARAAITLFTPANCSAAELRQLSIFNGRFDALADLAPVTGTAGTTEAAPEEKEIDCRLGEKSGECVERFQKFYNSKFEGGTTTATVRAYVAHEAGQKCVYEVSGKKHSEMVRSKSECHGLMLKHGASKGSTEDSPRIWGVKVTFSGAGTPATPAKGTGIRFDWAPPAGVDAQQDLARALGEAERRGLVASAAPSAFGHAIELRCPIAPATAQTP